jgi:hypothetical protein
LAVAACGGSSPTGIDESPSAVAVVVEDAGALAEHEPLIRDLVATTFDRAQRQIPISGLTAFIRPDASRTIPGWGLGGFALGPSQIEITVDAAYPDLVGILVARLPHIAAHEMLHAARFRGPGNGFTLFEVMISEGLADHFAEELLGGPLPPWAVALAPADIDRYLALAAPELDEPNDYDRWFFGFDPDIPRWTGYTLGYHLVAEYQAREGRSAAELVHTPASAFRPDCGRAWGKRP